MLIETWLILALTCLLGAMSPGPSLAVIMQASLNHGRRIGVCCACAHAGGVAAWALLTVFGISALLIANPSFKRYLELAGAAYLLYLACKILYADFAKRKHSEKPSKTDSRLGPIAASFVIAFANPKLLVFFFALFSQFVSSSQGLVEKFTMVFIATVVDAVWYVIVSVTVTHSATNAFLRQHIKIINTFLALIFVLLAVKVIGSS
jgi:threonine efflux protein